MKKDTKIIIGVFTSVIAGIITEYLNKGCIIEQYLATETEDGFLINTICKYDFWGTIFSLIGVFILTCGIIYLVLYLGLFFCRITNLIKVPKKKRKSCDEIIKNYFSIKNEFIILVKSFKGCCLTDNSLKLLHFTELCRIINALYETLSQVSPDNSSAIFRNSNFISDIDKYISRYDCIALIDNMEKLLNEFICNDKCFQEDFELISAKITELRTKI